VTLARQPQTNRSQDPHSEEPAVIRFASSLLLTITVAGNALFAQNLLDNGEFDLNAGLSGWQSSLGSMALVEDSGGCASSDALLGSSAPAGGGLQAFSIVSQQCLPFNGSVHSEVSLGAMYRTTASIWTRLDLAYFSSEDCTGASSFSESVFGSTSATWQRIAGTVAVPATVRSLQLFVSTTPMTTAEPAYTVEWDRIYLGLEPELLVDGFELEGGSTCRWSTASGEI
jgi:hypothetical protein